MKVKVALGSDIRVWRRKQDDMQSLKNFASKSFEQLLGVDFLLTYEDDEGERVTLTDDEDLTEAFECAEEEKRKSLKVFIILTKQAQGIEPGAFQPVQKVVTETKSGEEIVSEPGEERKVDEITEVKAKPLKDTQTPQTNDPATRLNRSDPALRRRQPARQRSVDISQIEGLPTRQSVVQWVRQLLPLLADHGVTDELKDALPELFVSLDAGDELGTAIQSMIARCSVLQEQAAVQEFMRHVQSKVAPLSGEIVPHVLRLGVPGMSEIVAHLATVASQWQSGVSNLHFDMTPIFLKLWPAFIAKMESQNQGPCDVWLDKIKLPAFTGVFKNSFKESEIRDSSFKETPFAPTKMNAAAPPYKQKFSSTVPNYRLAAVEDDNRWSKTNKGTSWRNSRFRRKGRGGRQNAWGRNGRQQSFTPQHSFNPYPNFPPNPYSASVPNHRIQNRQHQNYNYQSDFPNYRSSSQNQAYHSSVTRWDNLPPVGHTQSLRRPISRKGNDGDFKNNQWDRGMPPPQAPNFGRNLSRKSNNDEKKSGIRISATPLKAEFIDHVNIPLRSKYLPTQKLLKKWCVRNVGGESWDGQDVSLHFTKGDSFLPTRTVFKVPSCKSGSLCELSAMIKTPTEVGRYTAYFRLVKGETFFGPRIWVDIHVVKTEEELAKDDEQTAKRLERFEKQQTILRESPMNPHRHSARRSKTKSSSVRETTRRSRKKSSIKSTDNHNEESFSALGLVEIPVPSSRIIIKKSEKRTDDVPKTPKSPIERLDFPKRGNILVNEIEPKPEPKPKTPDTPYQEQLRELESMGFGQQPDGSLLKLLNQHKGDVNRVVDDILSQQHKV